MDEWVNEQTIRRSAAIPGINKIYFGHTEIRGTKTQSASRTTVKPFQRSLGNIGTIAGESDVQGM